MRRDTPTVFPETPVEEVIRLIDCNDIQRVCVVDKEGYFLGLISDRDLLAAFSDRSSRYLGLFCEQDSLYRVRPKASFGKTCVKKLRGRL